MFVVKMGRLSVMRVAVMRVVVLMVMIMRVGMFVPFVAVTVLMNVPVRLISVRDLRSLSPLSPAGVPSERFLLAGVAWSLLFRQHVHFRCRNAPAAHFVHLKTRANLKGCRSPREHCEGDACIHQRAQHHVAADPGKTLQIANTHRFVILA